MSKFPITSTDAMEQSISPLSFSRGKHYVSWAQQSSRNSSSLPSRRLCHIYVTATTVLHLLLLGPASSFVVSPATTTRCRRFQLPSSSSSSSPSKLCLAAETNALDEQIAKQLERAKAVLAVSKAKMEAREAKVAGISNNDDAVTKTRSGMLGTDVPFFATINGNGAATKNNGKKERVIKSKDESTGLFTTDGDLMAKLSEGEEWQTRRLLDVFSNEQERLMPKNNPLANRDVAASINNLRRVLQTEDFMRIFDKRNRFIGDP